MAATLWEPFPPVLLLDPTMTTILVGPEKQPFGIHKSLLCHFSNYFGSAYESRTTEAEKHEFILPDVDEIVVCSLASWLYTGEVYVGPGIDGFWMFRTLGDEQEDDLGDDDDEYEFLELPETDIFMSENDDTYDRADGEEEWHRLVSLLNVTKTTQATELHVYQLRALIKLSEEEGRGIAYVPKWKEVLQQKEAAEADDNTDSSEATLEEDPPTSPLEDDWPFTLLTELYILAERFDIPALRHSMMDRLQGHLHKSHAGLPSFQTVITVFENLPPTSKLCLWLVHVFAYLWDPSRDDAEQVALRQSLPKDFMMEVMVLNATRMPKALEGETTPLQMDLCLYHDHETYEEVKQCRMRRGVAIDSDKGSDGEMEDDEDYWEYDEEDEEVDEEGDEEEDEEEHVDNDVEKDVEMNED